MRGTDQPQTAMFSYLSVEDRIPAEHPLRALRLQVLSTIRSERQLMELLKYNLRFRWVVGLNPDDAVWVPTVFRKNRDRLGRVLLDHRHGLIVATDVRAPGSDAERDAAVEMLTTLEPRTRRRTSPKIFMRRNTRAPLTGGRRATRGTRSVRGIASWSKKRSGGARRLAGSAHGIIGGARRWRGSSASPTPPPPTRRPQ